MTSSSAFLRSVATASPDVRYAQEEASRLAQLVFSRDQSDIERLQGVFKNSGVGFRRSVVPPSWLLKPHGFEERTRLFRENALALAEEAALLALERAELQPDEVDALVFCSSTGVSVPGIDSFLFDRLALRRTARRLQIFGYGCAGGVLGLSRAAELSLARPGERVLFVVVELCSLTFQPQDQSKSNIVALALFADGAAAAVLQSGEAGSVNGESLALTAWGERTWPRSQEIMGWHAADDGFGVLFSPRIPQFLLQEFAPAVDSFLAEQTLTRDALAGYVVHPGGAKVVGALEATLGLADGALEDSRAVLREYGNMSAPTVLFVLERAVAGGMTGRHLMAAVGPGFTAGFMLLEGNAEAQHP